MSATKKYDRIEELIRSANARFVSVYFIKKNGGLRQITFNKEASKTHVKGAETDRSKKAVISRAKNNPNLLNVWDHSKQGFRSVNMNTITKIVVDGRVYTFG